MVRLVRQNAHLLIELVFIMGVNATRCYGLGPVSILSPGDCSWSDGTPKQSIAWGTFKTISYYGKGMAFW